MTVYVTTEEPKTWKELYDLERKAKAPIEAAYTSVVAPLRRKMNVDLADLERTYQEKVRQAKADLYAAQRRHRETLATLKKWRDATESAVTREYDNARQPAAVRKRQDSQGINDWYAAQRERLLKENVTQ